MYTYLVEHLLSAKMSRMQSFFGELSLEDCRHLYVCHIKPPAQSRASGSGRAGIGNISRPDSEASTLPFCQEVHLSWYSFLKLPASQTCWSRSTESLCGSPRDLWHVSSRLWWVTRRHAGDVVLAGTDQDGTVRALLRQDHHQHPTSQNPDQIP